MENPTLSLQIILGRNIRAAREKLGYSQQHLAERADLSPGHITDLEKGRKWVSADSLARIADALGIEPFMLLLPADYSADLDAFSLLTEYAMSVRERMTGTLDATLREMLGRRDRVDDGHTGHGSSE
ncbi:MAG: XRE family transcriptional regulator [Spirochaetaceae bacterium]|nr:MAG: XRE family transcriptional regulator [Spirochaetaceae bacterium]